MNWVWHISRRPQGKVAAFFVPRKPPAVFKQSLLEDCPVGAQKIGHSLSILEKDGRVTYFVGGDNYFSHPQGDEPSRRFVLASLMENGHVRARDLEGAPWFCRINGVGENR